MLGVIHKLTILEHKNGLVLPNTHVPVSGDLKYTFSLKLFQILNKCVLSSQSEQAKFHLVSGKFLYSFLNLST